MGTGDEGDPFFPREQTVALAGGIRELSLTRTTIEEDAGVAGIVKDLQYKGVVEIRPEDLSLAGTGPCHPREAKSIFTECFHRRRCGSASAKRPE